MPLSLTAPPQFQETPPLVLEVKELEAVTLRCVALGSPRPYVTWKFRGQDLGKGQGQVQVSGVSWTGKTKREGRRGTEAKPGDGSEEGHAIDFPEVEVLPPSAGQFWKCRV